MLNYKIKAWPPSLKGEGTRVRFEEMEEIETLKKVISNFEVLNNINNLTKESPFRGLGHYVYCKIY